MQNFPAISCKLETEYRGWKMIFLTLQLYMYGVLCMCVSI